MDCSITHSVVVKSSLNKHSSKYKRYIQDPIKSPNCQYKTYEEYHQDKKDDCPDCESVTH